MKDKADYMTPDFPGMAEPRRGRPRKADALTGAERARRHRLKAKEKAAAGRVPGGDEAKGQGMEKIVDFTVLGLTDAEAWEFAQFLKRVGLSDYKRLAEGDGEARAMLEAGEKVRAGLAAAGYAPR